MFLLGLLLGRVDSGSVGGDRVGGCYFILVLVQLLLRQLLELLSLLQLLLQLLCLLEEVLLGEELLGGLSGLAGLSHRYRLHGHSRLLLLLLLGQLLQLLGLLQLLLELLGLLDELSLGQLLTVLQLLDMLQLLVKLLQMLLNLLQLDLMHVLVASRSHYGVLSLQLHGDGQLYVLCVAGGLLHNGLSLDLELGGGLHVNLLGLLHLKPRACTCL